MSQFMLYAHRNTASDNMVRCEWKVHKRKGSKNTGFPRFILWIWRQKVYCLIELDLTLNLRVFFSVRCIPLSLRSKTRRRATLLLPTWICSCQSVGTVNFALPFTTNVTISISILQTFRSWVATSHLRPPMAFLSHNSSDTPGLAPLMNVLFWGRCDSPISFSGRDMSRNVWNRL